MARLRRRRAAGGGGFQPETLSAKKKKGNRKRKRRKRGGAGGIRKDLNGALDLLNDFNLAPPLTQLDTGTPDNVADLIAEQQGVVDEAGTRDADQQDLLDLLKGGLGGLTATENQATREASQESLDRGLQEGFRNLSRLSAGRGVLGGAANAGIADLIRGSLEANRGLERDLQVANIGIQDDRRNNFGAFLDQLVTGEASRERGARNDLSTLLQQQQDNKLQREGINLDQEKSQVGLRNNNLLGLLGLIGNRQSTRKAFQLEKRRLGNDAARTNATNNQANSISGLINSTQAGSGI